MRRRARKGRHGATAAALALVAVLFGAQALAQRVFERRWPHPEIENLIYVPAGPHVRAISLGFTSLHADLLWMKAIGYFGGHVLTDQEYPWLSHILDQVTTLDPLFTYPYVFGGIVLAVYKNDPEQSIRILQKGMRHYPGDWRYPFYIGFTYFYGYRDAHRAAPYMNLAASLPGSPPYVPRLAANLLAETGRLDTAVRFLETVAEGVRDEAIRDQIIGKIADLRAGRIPAAFKAFLAGEEAP